MKHAWRAAAAIAAGVVVVAGTVAWGARDTVSATESRGWVGAIAQSIRPAPTLRVPAGTASQAGPQVIRFDAETARQAMREGELRVALPDGSTYPVHMERQFTDEAGRWSVVGRVKTPHGGQAMVLTFGAGAVFGLLPTPDGGAMQIATGPGNRVTIAAAGGLTPDLASVRGRNDYLLPPSPTMPKPAAAPADRPQRAASEMATVSTAAGTPTRVAAAQAAPVVPIDETPVTIRVLAMYPTEQVVLRGSRAAVETEIANLFAIANQAHLDSDSRVRLQVAAMREIPIPAGFTNDELLNILRTFYFEFDFEVLRDTYEADLTTFVRPLPDGEQTCGTSWLNGAGYRGSDGLRAEYAGSVVNVGAGCGAYVLAHELGHLMGAAHDRAAQTDADGNVSHGAYAYSFGYRTDAYATIMADPGAGTWFGRFSSGAPYACGGARCGVTERIDNVRTFNRMAPAIAAFRQKQNTAWVADVEAVEARYAHMPIRLAMPAPEGGLFFGVQISGTATAGIDYFENSTSQVYFPAGAREAQVFVNLRNDTAIEGNETFVLRIVPPAGIAVSDDTGVLTIVDDDPTPIVRGRLLLPPGESLEYLYQNLRSYGERGSDFADGWDNVYDTFDLAFSVPVVRGAPLKLEWYDVPEHLHAPPVALQEVWEDQVLDIPVTKKVRVTGMISVDPEMLPTTMPPMLDVKQYVDGKYAGMAFASFPNDPDHFVLYAIPGATLHAYINGTMTPVDGNTRAFESWSATYENVREDFVFNPVRSTTRYVTAIAGEHAKKGTPATVEIARYTFDVGSTSLQVPFHTVDGTAKAGVHYADTSGFIVFSPGQYTATLEIETFAESGAADSRTFDVVLDDSPDYEVVNPSARVTIRGAGRDLRKGGPGARD